MKQIFLAQPLPSPLCWKCHANSSATNRSPAVQVNPLPSQNRISGDWLCWRAFPQEEHAVHAGGSGCLLIRLFRNDWFLTGRLTWPLVPSSHVP